MDLGFIQTLPHMLLLLRMAIVGHMKLYLGSIKRAKPIWPKVERSREVRKERFFMSFQ